MTMLLRNGFIFVDVVVKKKEIEVLIGIGSNIILKEIDEGADEVVVVELDGLNACLRRESRILNENILKSN